MVITYVYPNESKYWENFEWRCVVPSEAINRTGIHKANLITDVDFSSNSNECITACLESDIIVIYKKLYGRVISAIHHWQAREKTIIVDFDEPYQLYEPGTKDHQLWHEGMQRINGNSIKYISPSPLTQFKWGLKLVDGVTVPTNRLANDWLTFNDVEVIPDYIFPDTYTAQNKSVKKKFLTFGWHGKSQQFINLNTIGLFETIEEILDKHQHINFQIYIDDEIDFQNTFGERFTVNTNVEKKEWIKELPGIDVGLVPIIGDFDQRQPDRSVLEYMVMKIPWIASHGSAFHELAVYGSIVENTKENWKHAIEEMIVNYDAYKTNAEHEPYLFGIERSIDENIHHTLALYEKILQSRKRQLPVRSEDL